MRRVVLFFAGILVLSLSTPASAQQPLPKPPSPPDRERPSRPLPPPLERRIPRPLPKPLPSPPMNRELPASPELPAALPNGSQEPKQHLSEAEVTPPGKTSHRHEPAVRPKPSPPEIPPPPPAAGDRVLWSAPIDIRYGATFDLRGSDPYRVTVEETYNFVESQGVSPIDIVGYCEEKFPFLATDPRQSYCPLHPAPGPELRLSKQYVLSAAEHAPSGYLHEEFVLTARPIWVLIADRKNPPKWRFLNYFQGLQDPFRTPNNARMSTLLLNPHTFVSLDQAQREESPDADTYHFPRQFLFETLQPRTTVITRVNPRIPRFLRWGAQRLLTVGVANVAWQWVLLVLAPITPLALLGWLGRLVFHGK